MQDQSWDSFGAIKAKNGLEALGAIWVYASGMFVISQGIRQYAPNRYVLNYEAPLTNYLPFLFASLLVCFLIGSITLKLAYWKSCWNITRLGIYIAAAGATGNHLERFLTNAVTDFIPGTFFGRYRTYNVNDALIAIGAAIAIVFLGIVVYRIFRWSYYNYGADRITLKLQN